MLATQVLDSFNEATGKRYSGKDWLRAIVSRIRDHPDLSFERYAEIVKQQVAHPWWRGDPTPSVIFGNAKVFDRALNGARGKKKDERLAAYNRTTDEQPTYYPPGWDEE